MASGCSSRLVPWLCAALLVCCLPGASPGTGPTQGGARSTTEGQSSGEDRKAHWAVGTHESAHERTLRAREEEAWSYDAEEGSEEGSDGGWRGGDVLGVSASEGVGKGRSELPGRRRLHSAHAVEAALRKPHRIEGEDPPDASYGYAYSVDEMLAQEREDQVGSQRRATLEACTPVVEAFVEQERAKDREGGQARGSEDRQVQALRWMLFFLHVPRTGGRTYHQCFLKALFPVDQRCPRSYDALRFDLRVPACRLLATHNDYSLMTKLPAANVSVMTNVRDPVDRVISAYEFAMETAVRSLRWGVKLAPGESLTEGRRRVRMGMGHGPRTETRNVWPWHLLIPLLEDELWARRPNTSDPLPQQTKAEGQRERGGSSYEKGELMMPLSAFLEHPSVRDLLHNGATFHIAGITENSLLKGASFLRACASQHEQLGQLVLSLVRARLDQMLHIGLTAAHKESAMLLAAALGRSLQSKAFVGPDPRLLALGNRRLSQGSKDGLQMREARIREMQRRTGPTLLSHYDRCVELQRKRYVGRRRAGLHLLGPGVNFSPEARARIDPATIQRIRELNRLDSQLLEYARAKFEQQKEVLADKLEQMKREDKAVADSAEQGGTEGPPVPGLGRRKLLNLRSTGAGLPRPSVGWLMRPALVRRRLRNRSREAWKRQAARVFSLQGAGPGRASLAEQGGALARFPARNCTSKDGLRGDRVEDSTDNPRQTRPLAYAQGSEQGLAVCCGGDGLQVH